CRASGKHRRGSRKERGQARCGTTQEAERAIAYARGGGRGRRHRGRRLPYYFAAVRGWFRLVDTDRRAIRHVSVAERTAAYPERAAASAAGRAGTQRAAACGRGTAAAGQRREFVGAGSTARWRSFTKDAGAGIGGRFDIIPRTSFWSSRRKNGKSRARNGSARGGRADGHHRLGGECASGNGCAGTPCRRGHVRNRRPAPGGDRRFNLA